MVISMQVLEPIFEPPIPQKVQGPAHGIADYVGSETAVEARQQASFRAISLVMRRELPSADDEVRSTMNCQRFVLR